VGDDYEFSRLDGTSRNGEAHLIAIADEGAKANVLVGKSRNRVELESAICKELIDEHRGPKQTHASGRAENIDLIDARRYTFDRVAGAEKAGYRKAPAEFRVTQARRRRQRDLGDIADETADRPSTSALPT